MIRRQIWRNERSLYKHTCDLCKKEIISMYAPEKKYIVYCTECYQSDKWNPLEYGRDYDFSKSFFEQFQSLMEIVPRHTLYQDFVTASDYTNWAVYLKNCYLVFGGHHYEDSFYASQSFYLKDCFDVDFSKKSEQCYNSIHLKQCNRVYFSAFSEDSSNSWFLFGCKNCHNCVGCTNLRNASYCVFNEQYSKTDYKNKIKELDLNSRKNIDLLTKKFRENSLKFPRKFAWTKNILNSTGDDLEQVKNCHHCFSAFEDENCRYSFFVPTGAKDSFDLDHCGLGTELTCELMSGFGNNKVLYGNRIYYCHDIYYSDDCHHSNNLLGCISLRKKEYCILNKQYSKEEYEKLLPKIIEHLKENQYKSKDGKTYKFGEFFPFELSPFSYNETVAQEYFPLSKIVADTKGYTWQDQIEKNYKITLKSKDLPDQINIVNDEIINQVIECKHKGNCTDQCSTAFRIVNQEFQFYKKTGIPLPELCPNCRHYERLKQRNPLKLWSRKCLCAGSNSTNKVYQNTVSHFHGENPCFNEFQTSYSPDRPEIIYCEACYNAEVV